MTNPTKERLPKIETGLQELDLNQFTENKDILKPIQQSRVIVSLSTARFEDLARWYRIRDYQHVDPGFEKPMYGQTLEFNNLDDFISGITSARHPRALEIGNEHSGITIHDGNLVICNGNKLEIVSPTARREFVHPLFNDLKFVDFSQDGKTVLVSSSGTDCLLEFSYPDMKLVWT